MGADCSRCQAALTHLRCGNMKHFQTRTELLYAATLNHHHNRVSALCPHTHCFLSLFVFWETAGLDQGDHILQGSPDSMQLEPSRRSWATCVAAAALAAGSSLYPPLICVCIIRCSVWGGWGGHILFPLTAPRGGNIGKINRSPAEAELREGGAGTEDTLRAANKRPPAHSAPSMFVYTRLMPRGGLMPCLHRSGTDIPLCFTPQV